MRRLLGATGQVAQRGEPVRKMDVPRVRGRGRGRARVGVRVRVRGRGRVRG